MRYDFVDINKYRARLPKAVKLITIFKIYLQDLVALCKAYSSIVVIRTDLMNPTWSRSIPFLLVGS